MQTFKRILWETMDLFPYFVLLFSVSMFCTVMYMSYAKAEEHIDIYDSVSDKEKVVIIYTDPLGKEHKLLIKQMEMLEKVNEIERWVRDRKLESGR